MSSLTIGQKAQRVLRVLLGLRNARITARLVPYGLTQAVIQEGWSLLRALAANRLDTTVTAADPSVIAALDAWENRWFPIAQASLRRHHPRVAERVFRNLTQQVGPEVVVSVSTFIDRYDALVASGTGGAPADPEGAAARELLASRGLTPEVVEAARTQVRSLGQMTPMDPSVTDELEERWRVAEDQLWAWYLEWSQIIRTAVKDRRLLHQLGFLSRRGGRLVEASEDDLADATGTPGAPAAAGTSGSIADGSNGAASSSSSPGAVR